MSSGDFPEKTIVLALQSGDRREEDRAVRVLLKQYGGMVISIVKKHGGGNEEEAGIILNDAVLDLVKAIRAGRYDPEKGSLGTYLFKIAENKWLTHYRKKNSNREKENRYALFLSSKVSQESVGEDTIKERELVGLIADALEKLDANCYEVLKKFWLENKPHEQIAEELGITHDNARQRNRRCKEKLRKILGRDPRRS